MLNVQPKTFNQAICLAQCLEVRRYAPKITDDIIENMYHFLSENPLNKVGISNGTIYYVQSNGEKGEAYSVETVPGFDQLVLTGATFQVINSTFGSGGSGCSGCSSNNNNNNNNNNG